LDKLDKLDPKTIIEVKIYIKSIKKEFNVEDLGDFYITENGLEADLYESDKQRRK